MRVCIHACIYVYINLACGLFMHACVYSCVHEASSTHALEQVHFKRRLISFGVRVAAYLSDFAGNQSNGTGGNSNATAGNGSNKQTTDDSEAKGGDPWSAYADLHVSCDLHVS